MKSTRNLTACLDVLNFYPFSLFFFFLGRARRNVIYLRESVSLSLITFHYNGAFMLGGFCYLGRDSPIFSSTSNNSE